MRAIGIGLVSCLLLATAATASAEDDSPGPLIAFIGEQLSFEVDPCPPGRPCFNAIFDARYRVVKPLQGKVPTSTIDFRVADHYGFPDFAAARHALVFVYLTEDGNVMRKYFGYPVHPTADGDWASCGHPSNFADPLELEEIEFMPAVVVDDVERLSPAGIAEYDPDIYEVVDGRVSCRKGVRVEAIFAFWGNDEAQAAAFGFGKPPASEVEP